VSKQALIIGLGQFGMALTRSLAERGVEVIAVDMREDRIQVASRFTDQALCVDAADEDALARLAPERRDFCVCAIGDEAREGAIIVTALLRRFGAKRIVARAGNDVTKRILELVGAHEVVNPEQAFGERMATRLIFDEILEEMPLGPGLVMANLKPLPAMVGKTLIDLALPRRFGITVVAQRRSGEAKVGQPDPRRPIEAEDMLVVVAEPGAIERMLKSW
jgi:trk system potassium uptake protein TrkA